MGHWEDKCGAPCEVWELETCSGVLMLLPSGNCLPTPDVARRFLAIGTSCNLPPHCSRDPVPACLGQGDPVWSPAVPVVLPTLSENIFGDVAAQLDPCLQLAAPEGVGSV